jgi:hypothetical protein
MIHRLSDKEYGELLRIWREKGRDVGIHEAKKRMGDVLDKMAEQARYHPYRAPYWPQQMQPNAPFELPRTVEFTHDQLIVLRHILCGAP